jgi:uncharacterized protein
MQLDLEKPDGNIIRSYSPGELRVNDRLLSEPVILTATEIHTAWSPPPINDLSIADFEIALAQNPELILFGTGSAPHFPPPALVTAIMKLGIGFEFMDTAAACRTYNVLASENRRVVAALLLR